MQPEHKYLPSNARAQRELEAAGFAVEPKGCAWRVRGRKGRMLVDGVYSSLQMALVELVPGWHRAR